MFILAFAYGIIHKASFLECVDDGWRWEQSTICGSLFTLFHMMTIMMQTMMEVKIFVWIPQKEGLLETEGGVAAHENQNIDKPYALDSLIQSMSKVDVDNNDDDDFRAA
jgi:hypothetical protein